MKGKMVATAVALFALPGFGYDIHLKSLTPVKELTRPAPFASTIVSRRSCIRVMTTAWPWR